MAKGEKPIIAFREWNVSDGRLAPRYPHAAAGHNPWSSPRGTVRARCPTGGHRAGSRGCSCGLYGYYGIPATYQPPILDHKTDPVADPEAMWDMSMDAEVIFGAYIGFGRTTQGEKGIRSEKARIVGFRWSPTAEKLAELYEVPVCDTPAELKAAGLKWGRLIDPPPPIRHPAVPPVRLEEITRNAVAEQKSSGGLWGLTSGYRSPAQQAALAAQAGAAPIAHVALTLILHHGSSIRSMVSAGMEPEYRIDGVDHKVWKITNVTEQIESREIPLAGTSRMSMRPGRMTMEVELEANIAVTDLDRKMTELTKVGTVFNVNRSHRW